MSGAEILNHGAANSVFAQFLLWSFVFLSLLALGVGVHSALQHRRIRQKKQGQRARRAARARRR